MKVIAQNSKLSGHITVPGSKSHTIRALILASISYGESFIKNPLPSNDCISTLNAIEKIGAKLKEKKIQDGEEVWVISGAGNNFHIPQNQIDVGNSGSLMYFLCPVLSTLSGECLFSGDESICTRPVGHLLDALHQLGAQAESTKKPLCPPFKFCGPIDISKKLITEGTLSQYISGFMMAASKTCGNFEIELTNPKETPYLTMTKMWLNEVGVECSISSDFKKISIKGPVDIQGFSKTIPSDWEGVAFPLIAALISKSTITIDNVDFSGSQGDDKIVEILQSVGAKILLNKESKTLTVCGGEKLSTENCRDGIFRIDISSFPDAICALCVIACFIEGTTVINEVEICRKKETDRVWAMCKELTKLGADIREQGDSIIIKGEQGGKNLHGGNVESYKDHRIAMSLSCLGLGLNGEESVIIEDAECCSVSFPNYFEKMNKLGAGYKILS